MKPHTLLIATTAIYIFVLTGCNNNDAKNSNITETGNVLILTDVGQLASIDSDKPDNVITSELITGLRVNDSIIGIDYRPADNQLYGVSNLGDIYAIDPITSHAELKSTLIADVNNNILLPFNGITGTLISMDFNPVTDRLRVIGDDGQILRINVDTGAVTTYSEPNSAANANTKISSIAFSNSFFGSANTKLYEIDINNDRVYLRKPTIGDKLAEFPPLSITNKGNSSVNNNDNPIQTAALLDIEPIKFSPLGVNAEGSSSFDIHGISNQSYAVLTVDGRAQLYKINLATIGEASPVSTLIGNLPPALQNVRGIAIKPVKDAITRLQ